MAKQRLFFGASSEAAFYDASEVTNLDSIKRPTNSSRFCFFFQEKMNEPLKPDFFPGGGGQIYMGRKLSVFSGLLVLEGAYHWALEVFFSIFA